MKYLLALIFVIIFLTFAAAITFSFVIFSDLDELGGEYDVYKYFCPLSFYTDHVVHSGQFPLWNSLVYCGMPMSGNPQSFVFYPPYLLRSLLTSEPTPDRSAISMALYMGLHLVFMAFCTYLFGRAHKLSVAGSLAAALSFSFSAIMVMRMCDYIFVPTIAWLPLILLLLKKTIDAQNVYRKLGIGILAGFALGMCILSGFVQILNLLGLIVGLYSFLYFLLYTDWSKHNKGFMCWKPWFHNGIAMALVVIVASGTAAVLLLPTFEFAPFTVRSGGAAINKLSNLWGYTPLMLFQSMVVYPGMDVVGESIRNSGIIALILAFAGLAHIRARDVFIFLGIYLILFECSFGPPLPIGTLLEKWTPFALSSYTRAYDFALFPLSMLVGYGMDAMSRPLSRKGHSYTRVLAILMLAFVLLVPFSQWMEEIKSVEVNRGVLIIPMLAIPIMLLTGTFRMTRLMSFIAAAILLLLLLGEIAIWNQSFVPRLAKRKVTDVINIPKDHFSITKTNNRESDHISNRLLYGLRFAMNGIDPMHVSAVRDLLSGPPRDQMSKRWVIDWEVTRENLRGNMLFKRSFWLARQYAVGKLPDKRTPFPSATLVFLENEIDEAIPKVDLFQLPESSISEDMSETVISSPDMLLPIPNGKKKTMTFAAELPEKVEGKPAGPAGAVHSALTCTYTSSTDAQIDAYFTQPGTDRAENGIRHTIRPGGEKTGQIEIPLPDFRNIMVKITVDNTGNGEFCFKEIKIRSDNLDEDGLIEILERKANSVKLRVGLLEQPRVLTFLDLYYPGWHAYIDGVETPILKANEQFKAVVLPQGTHEVDFQFKPQSVMQGLSITAVTTLMGILMLIFCWKKSRKYALQ